MKTFITIFATTLLLFLLIGESKIRTTVVFGNGKITGVAPAISPDGNCVFFHSFDEKTRHTIFVSFLQDTAWTTPIRADFTGHDDLEPFFSADGKKLFFSSARAVFGEDRGIQIWYVEKNNGSWNNPKLIEDPVNLLDKDNVTPSISPSGNIYFGSNRRSGKWPFEIYFSKYEKGQYSKPENINDMVNPGFFSWSHCIAPDENFLIFASEKPEGFGEIDLYISFKEKGKWQAGRNMGSLINTTKSELWPRLSPCGKFLFFTRGGEPKGTIHQIELKKIVNKIH